MRVYFNEICPDSNISKYSINVEQLLRDEMRQTMPVCIRASSRPEHSKDVSRHWTWRQLPTHIEPQHMSTCSLWESMIALERDLTSCRAVKNRLLPGQHVTFHLTVIITIMECRNALQSLGCVVIWVDSCIVHIHCSIDEYCKFQNMRKTDPFMWPHAGISAKGTAAPGSAPDCKLHWTKIKDNMSCPFNDVYKSNALPQKLFWVHNRKRGLFSHYLAFSKLQATTENDPQHVVVLQPWHDII